MPGWRPGAGAGRWALALAGALLLAAAPAAALEPVTLQLKWRHQFQFAGYYAAQTQGYYAAEGLAVTLVEGAPEYPPLQRLLSGAVQYAVTGSDALEARLRGDPVVVLAVIFQHSPYVLLTRRDRGLLRPADLLGRTVMLDDAQGGSEFKAMLLEEGLSAEQLRIVPHSWENDDLIEGRTDALSAYVSVEPFQLAERGVEVAQIRPVAYGVDFYGDVLLTTEAEVADHPARAAAMRRASLRGWEYAFAHVDELVAEILAMPGARARGLTAAALRFEAERMRELVLPTVIELGHSNPGRWQRMADTYVRLGLAPPGVPLDGFVFDPHPSIEPRTLRLALAALAVLAALGGVVLVWNRQLRRVVRQRTADLVRAEREQRQQHEVLQSVLDNMGEGVIVVDRDAALVLMNPAARALYGDAWPADPARWPAHFQLYRPDGVTPFAPDDLPLARALRGEACDAVEIHVGAPPRAVILHATARPIRDAAGTVRAAVVVLRDVTERERAAAALRDSEARVRTLNALLEERVRERTARLELANQELEAFAYSVSHDLRAPLRHLQGFAQILREDYGPTLDEAGRNYVQRIAAAAARMGQLIDALLGLSRLSSGALVRRPVDLGELAEVVAAELRQSQPGRDVVFDIAPHVVADGDPRLLGQVLRNLLENAWKYSVHRHPAHIAFGVADDRPAAGGAPGPVYFVRDDGVGFDPANADGLFRPFRRLHQEAEFEGTGIGLATVQRIIRRHGGEIWAEAAPEQGATFYFTLGATAAAAAA